MHDLHPELKSIASDLDEITDFSDMRAAKHSGDYLWHAMNSQDHHYVHHGRHSVSHHHHHPDGSTSSYSSHTYNPVWSPRSEPYVGRRTEAPVSQEANPEVVEATVNALDKIGDKAAKVSEKDPEQGRAMVKAATKAANEAIAE